MAVIAPRKTGSGIGFFIVGGLFLALDSFVVVTQGAGEPGAVTIRGGAITMAGIIGGVIIALGFSVRLFGNLEARLIEIEQVILANRQAAAPPTQPGAAPSPPPPHAGGPDDARRIP